MDFGSLVKKYREKNLLTQTELAEKLGVHQKTISFMETSESRIPIKRNIRKLIDVLNIPEQEVFDCLTSPKTHGKIEKVNSDETQNSTEEKKIFSELILIETTEDVREVSILSITTGEIIGSYSIPSELGNKFDFFLKITENCMEFYIEAGMLLGVKECSNCDEGELVVIKNMSQNYIIKKFKKSDILSLVGKVVLKTTDPREI